MARCSDCESADREGGHYCEACGAKIEPEVAEAEPEFAPLPTEDESPALSMNEDENAVGSMPTEDADAPESPEEPESGTDSMPAESEGSTDFAEAEGEGPAEAADTEEPLSPELPKAGYLVFPDSTEQPIPPSQWLIGRADLAKFLPDPDKANEISRGHLTVFQEGDRFFIEDGKTMVQRRASTNKTWLVRGSSRILVTGTGRTELQEDDEIDVAELVKLQFVRK